MIKEKRTLILSVFKSIAILLTDAGLILLADLFQNGLFIVMAATLSWCILSALILIIIAPYVLKLGGAEGECIVERGTKGNIRFSVARKFRFLYGRITAVCNIDDGNTVDRRCIILPSNYTVAFLCKYVGSWRVSTDAFFVWDPFGIFIRKIKINKNGAVCFRHICVVPVERKGRLSVETVERFDSLLRPTVNITEMDGVRRYNSGDPVSLIAWKLVARTKKLYVRNMVGVNNGSTNVTYVCKNDLQYTTVATELILTLCKLAFANGSRYVNINSGICTETFDKKHISELELYLACAKKETEPSVFSECGLIIAPSGYNCKLNGKVDSKHIVFIGRDADAAGGITIDCVDEWVDNYE